MDDGWELTLHAPLRRGLPTRFFEARGGGAEPAACDRPLLNFAAKRPEGEWLIVASNIPGGRALPIYRERWAIECVFGDAKPWGPKTEDTRLTPPRKRGLPMALVALAIAWSRQAAVDLIGPGSPKRKRHGDFAKSPRLR